MTPQAAIAVDANCQQTASLLAGQVQPVAPFLLPRPTNRYFAHPDRERLAVLLDTVLELGSPGPGASATLVASAFRRAELWLVPVPNRLFALGDRFAACYCGSRSPAPLDFERVPVAYICLPASLSGIPFFSLEETLVVAVHALEVQVQRDNALGGVLTAEAFALLREHLARHLRISQAEITAKIETGACVAQKQRAQRIVTNDNHTCEICIVKGHIADLCVDAIVCPERDTLVLDDPPLTLAIELRQQGVRPVGHYARLGETVLKDARPKTNVRLIAHCAVYECDYRTDLKVIEKAVHSALGTLSSAGVEHLAVPVLGTEGPHRLGFSNCARVTMYELCRFAITAPKLGFSRIALVVDTDASFNIAQREFERIDPALKLLEATTAQRRLDRIRSPTTTRRDDEPGPTRPSPGRTDQPAPP